MIRAVASGAEVGGIDMRMWLSGRVQLDQVGQIGAIQTAVHGIAIKNDDKIHVASRLGERALPETIRVRRPLPWTAIFGVHHLAQGNPGLLHHAHMLAEIHQIL